MSIDISAAWIRRAQASGVDFLQAFAPRIEQALPDMVTVKKQKVSFFSREKQIYTISIRIENLIYTACIEKNVLKTRIASEIRSVVISTKEYSFAQWFERLTSDIERLAQTSNLDLSLMNMGS